MVSVMESSLVKPTTPPASSRILDIPCKVCGDFSSGKHYNIFACDGCAGFFKRSIRRNRQYVCKARDEGSCVINKLQRNQCRACRLAKCQAVGMNKDAVQHERGPRNSTLRRQQIAAQLFGENRERFGLIPNSPHSPLDLALPKPTPIPGIPPPLGVFPHFSPFAFPRFFPPIPAFLPPTLLPPTSPSEWAANIVLETIKWSKTLRDFIALPKSDQCLLLEESWRDLFLLSASLCPFSFDVNFLVEESGYKERNPDSLPRFVQNVKDFIDILRSIAQFQLDHTEYLHIRSFILFKTNFDKNSSSSISSGESKSLIRVDLVSSSQDQSQLDLSKHVSLVHPSQPTRFGRLLMLIPSLKNISVETIEELFFRNARNGPLHIDSVIRDMYKDRNDNVLKSDY
ncbi:nuclear receptor subfamily 2 group E member 1-like [Onthophagus taurus]|uniref:nuclear receptor subfamily 2 group E member 1-like n=1 Tax=Onthophagus taurus TaxID=166361 RepID=UPI000C20920D|nr:nuclear receptor subfamily 2 group E member 1-like [Onthophagus taurus]